MATQSLEKQSSAKWALVTGASSGLGTDFADQLAAKGYNLVLTARRTDRLLELKGRLEARYGIRAEVIGSDLAAPDSAARLHGEIRARGIAVDVLINNAGYGLFGLFAETPWEKTAAMLQVDIVALTQLTKFFADEMRQRGRGHVLLLSSIGAYQPTPTYAAYSAAKSYVLSFGEALNEELKGSGVKVTVLSPGVTATEFLQTAGQRPTLYQRMAMMQSAPVARIGLEAMFRGRASVIPGLMNRISIWMTGFLPRVLQARIAHVLMKN